MIRLLPLLALLGCAAGTAPDPREDRRPLSLHPDNPRVFLWRGQPTLLIGSGEHYGAVLNLDFDYATYPRTGACDGREEFDHPGGERRLATPPFAEDLALRLRRPL